MKYKEKTYFMLIHLMILKVNYHKNNSLTEGFLTSDNKFTFYWYCLDVKCTDTLENLYNYRYKR